MIRSACASDSLALGRVYCDAWKAAYRGIVSDDFLDSLTWENAAPPPERIDPDSCLVYDDNGMVAGLVRFGAPRDGAYSGYAEIQTIYVLPGFWRSGVGTKLFNAAAAALKTAGYSGVFLWTLKENARARSFYSRMGMTQCGEREITIADTLLDECRYEMTF